VAVIVQKYGGTSVEGRDRIFEVARKIAKLKSGGHDVVAVVSAQGRTTDELLREARSFAEEPRQRELDMLMTAGERISMSLLAIALNAIGCPAISFTGSQVGIITDTRHTDARILEVRPHRVAEEIGRGNVVVVGGFQGVSVDKDVTTLGRGGSDTTAVALAAALGAERCEILTDVDAVYTADPRKVARARPIDEISTDDMAELTRFGATVLKEEAVSFARRNGISLHVGPGHGGPIGTIVLEAPAHAEPPIVGLSVLSEATLLTGPRAALANASRELDDRGHRTKLFAGGRDSAWAVVETRHEAGVDAGGELRATAAGVVCAAGPEAAAAPTVAAALDALAREGTVVDLFAASGRGSRYVVPRESADDALRTLHSRFVESD